MVSSQAVGLILLALIAALWLVRAFTPARPFVYLFFLRFPLLAAAALIVFVTLAGGYFRGMLQNLFQLDNGRDVAIVTGLATLTGLTIAFTLVLMVRSIPRFFHKPGINLRERLQKRTVANGGPQANSKRSVNRMYVSIVAAIVLIVGLIIAAPAIVMIIRESARGALTSTAAIGFGLLGILLAVLGSAIIWGIAWGIHWIMQRSRLQSIRQFSLSRIPTPYRDDLLWHLTALILAIFTLGVFYFIGQWFPLDVTNQIPALGYLFLLFALLAWLLPGLSLMLDQFRIPTLAFILVISFVAWTRPLNDHFYEIIDKSVAALAQPQTPLLPRDALTAWLETHPVDEYPTMVIVTANGGGIRAAVWTAQVFKTLQLELGQKFAESIVLISSVSGGSVGTMYYVDAFDNGPPLEDKLEGIVDASRQNALSEIARGIAYSDVPRIFLGSLIPYDRDRGWALERTWSQRLPSGQPDVRLSDWRVGIEAGWRPAVIFNSTIVESGERFLLTSLDAPEADCRKSSTERPVWNKKYLYFSDCYPDYDLRIATAARMSASFPYVSPVSRPISMSGDPVAPEYHLGDGGYYDNNGLLSAIDWLRAVQEAIADDAGVDSTPKRKILIVHIRSAAGFTRPLPNDNLGWLYSFGGPIFTLVSAWNTTQVDRDDTQLMLFETMVPEHEVEQVFFAYCGPGSLSWQLADSEATAIVEQGFQSCLKKRHNVDNVEELEKAQRFFLEK